jgi:serine/threonine-protein kinase HipA
MNSLTVDLYGTHIGRLVGHGTTFDFEVAPAAIERWGLDSTILSLAIPLAPFPARSHRGRRQAFFRELLPEGRMLGWLSREAGVGETDVIGLLRRFGRDIAGALQIWDENAPGDPPHTEPADLRCSPQGDDVEAIARTHSGHSGCSEATARSLPRDGEHLQHRGGSGVGGC